MGAVVICPGCGAQYGAPAPLRCDECDQSLDRAALVRDGDRLVIDEATQRQLDRDQWIFGTAFVTLDGERVDPTTVKFDTGEGTGWDERNRTVVRAETQVFEPDFAERWSMRWTWFKFKWRRCAACRRRRLKLAAPALVVASIGAVLAAEADVPLAMWAFLAAQLILSLALILTVWKAD